MKYKQMINGLVIYKHVMPGDCHFTIHNARGSLIAASKSFRNQEWYEIGLSLMQDMLALAPCFFKEVQDNFGEELKGFSGILIRKSKRGQCSFDFITESGNRLLSSTVFVDERAVQAVLAQMQKLVIKSWYDCD